MKKIMLVVAYDGTNYCGWQIQPNGITVAEVLNRALTELTGEEIRVTGASRTDSGVHAMGNVAVFETEMRMPGEKYSFALNTRLPDDIKIQLSREVPADFHPRYTDTIKTYEYRILNRQFPDPLHRFYSCFLYGDLNVAAMQKACGYLVGTQDFRCFQASGETNPEKETVRTMYSAEIFREGEEIVFRIRGNGFLYNMVRIIAGTLIEIGRGRMAAEDMPEIIASKSREKAGPTAPPQGLTLQKIEYPAWGY